jgi:hypothetical protein
MIGIIGGIGLLFSYLGAAWSKDDAGSYFGSGFLPIFGSFGLMTVIGIFLFPRTIGLWFTPMSFATPIAFLIALFREGFAYAFFILAIGFAAWIVTQIVGSLRPDAT